MTIGELWRRIVLVLRRESRTRELEEEMRLHVELRAERLRQTGIPSSDAARGAHRRFGNSGAITDAVRDVWGGERIDGLIRELRFASRSLRRSPSFALTAVITLAIGIGATACIFGVVNAVLLRPLPYASSDRVVAVQHALPGLKMGAVSRLTLGMFFTYARLSKSIEAIAAYQSFAVNMGDSKTARGAERVQAGRITRSTFDVLRVTPRLGRAFSEVEDRPGGPAVMLISEPLWRRAFDADAAILGRVVSVDGTLRQIVGVMPEQFRFPDANTDVWIPLAADSHASFSGGFDQAAVARLRPGVELAGAQRELQKLIPRVSELYPFFAPGLPTSAMHAQAKPSVELRPLRETLVADYVNILWIIAGATGLVLLVACANVMNLLLVRADARLRELTVRTALGAGRLRLIGHVFAEVALVTGTGSLLGFAAAAAGTRLITRLAPSNTPRLAEIQIDGEVAAFTFIVAVCVAVACAFVATIRSGAIDLGPLLRDSNRTSTTARRGQRLRGVLVATQVALAVLLLASAGVLARSFERVGAVRPGFDDTNVLTMWLSTPEATYRNDAEITRYYSTVLERLAMTPGVVAVGAATKLPLDYDGLTISPIWPETGPLATSSLPPLTVVTTATTGYFSALRIPLVAGRTFSRGLRQSDPLEAVVTVSIAKAIWGDSTGTRVIGQRLRLRPGGRAVGARYTIVGVAGDVRDTSLVSPPPSLVYLALQPTPDHDDSHISSTMGIVVRTENDPVLSIPALRAAASGIDPSIPTFKVAALRDVVSGSVVRLSFTLFALGAGALVTLSLCMIGLYGVISYAVSLRTREIGIRIALGARPLNIAGLVTRQVLWLTLAGIVTGLALFVISSASLRTLVFGVATTDVATLTAVGLTLGATSMAAAWLSARKARSIDPVETLRHE